MNIADAMVNMIELARHFDLQVKAMRTAEENAAAAAQLLKALTGNRKRIVMNPALWAAKTGLDAQQTRMTVTSNNLANVNTNGFKKGRAVFEDLLYQNVRQVGAATSQDTQLPSGLHLGTGVRVVATEKIYTQGNLTQTGNSLDVAINGRGFFQVLLPDGTLGYTRDGSFQVSAQGELVTSSGYRGAARHHDSGRRAERHDRRRRRRQRAARRPDRADAGRLAAARRLHQSRRPAAARREPAARVRRQRSGAERHARPERPRPARSRARSRAPTSTSSKSW